MRRILVVALALVAAAALLSCTSSGDGGRGATDDFLNQGATLVSRGATQAEWVDLIEVTGDRDSTCIGVEAHRAFNVFAAAFTLTYDPEMLRYTGYDDAATCVGTGTNVLPTQVDASVPGRIVVGLSRNSSVTTTGVQCGRLIQVCFDVIGQGDTMMDFTGNTRLMDPSGATVAVEWVPSTVQTRL